MTKTGKRPLLWIAVIALSLIVATETFVILFLNYIYNPFVITDSSNRRFNPEQFRFSHYSHVARNEAEFNPAMLKMFPEGTDKNYVDSILVDQAGANVTKNQNSSYHNPGDGDYTYIYGNWLVRFIFDQNNRSVMMKMGKKPAYGTDPIDTFWEEKAHERK